MRKLILFCIAWLVAGSVSALQVRAIQDNQTAFFKISAKELTRIFVNGDRIQAVRGLDGAYQMTKDETAGAIFIRPEAYFQNKAFNLFLTTEQGHNFTLFLNPIDVPAENIELKPLSPVKLKAERWEKNAEYSNLLIQLTNYMANHTQPEGYAVINMGYVKPKKLANGLTMRLMKLYKGDHLQGEIWVVHNPNHKTFHLNPYSFYRNQVRSIAIQHETLQYHDETRLFRILSHD